ncbi:MAG: hypothetical protein AAF327_22310 [Cyanobacteria bacterium P01_A01_bin.37]
MVHSISRHSKALFPEVAIADLAHFQIAVLTTHQQVNQNLFSTQIAIPEKLDQTQGWLVYNRQLVASLGKLAIGDIGLKDSPFEPIRQLTPAIPISFEVNSAQPLPAQVSSQAAFSCNVPESDFPYLTVFHQMKPRFVAIYPLKNDDSLVDKVTQMAIDETRFIEQNYQHLKHIPFYQDNFGL